MRVDGLTHLSAKKQIVEDLVSQSLIPLSMIDVIADAQDLPRAYSHEDLASALPAGQQSRTWAVLAGTFPASITPLKPDDYEHHLERSEWLTFVDELGRDTRWRRPMYGDYATQPAIYTPSPAFRASPSPRGA